ncbi:D-glycero-beta-D-manno-heptose 1-phosphate adenylyltransferase [Inquilinus sp. KBS0705]|nr:D-glycero-beta-D-manno-heptose 1-phosphate adenylyltransferase [Inquilinus sp. KBS0705]
MVDDIPSLIAKKIVSRSGLPVLINEWKAAGQKLVFTNGVFDLVHIGHLSYLSKAAMMGNKLIIGLNSDESVQLLKGPDRPVNKVDTRAMLLASLFYVDAVVVFNEPTPADLIEQILPNVLVKGADYDGKKIAGADAVLAAGGKVTTIEFVNGQSSTAIINKIRQQAI